MIYEKEISGIFTKLRYTKVEDAEFILTLRLNPMLNRFLHKTEPDIDKQRNWVKEQQLREGDYYFIITDKESNPVGTVALYNISKEEKDAEFGRWICPNSSIYAFESLILIHDFGFGNLGLNKIYSKILNENKPALISHERFGYKFVKEIPGTDDFKGQKLTEYEILADDYWQIRNSKINLLKNITD